MQSIPYNRQTNNKIYYFGVITIPEIFIMLIVGMICLNLFKSPLLMVLAMFIYVLYLGLFRAGKPNGYDEHFFGCFWTPKIMRPGKLSPIPPVRPEKK
jgi:hypothetical protein